MIQGGYNGLHNWLKLDPKYVSEHYQGLSDYARWYGLDYDDPYDLLWTLLGYTNASIKPWLHPVIDPKAMNDLALDAQTGNNDSRELVVLFMYRSVSNVSRRFTWAKEMFGLESADLIHQGILGVYNALDKWSVNEKTDFPSWAEQWIFASIQEMVTLEAPIMKMPHHVRVLQSRLHKIREELETEILQRQASYEELAFYIRAEGYDTGITKMLSGPEIAILEMHGTQSLNEVTNDDETDYTELLDIIPDDGSNLLQGSSNLLKEVEYKDLLEALMERLDDVERFVLLNYNKGIMGKLKAKEVAEELVEKSMTDSIYSPSRITQTFERACIKIRGAAEELNLDKDMIFD